MVLQSDRPLGGDAGQLGVRDHGLAVEHHREPLADQRDVEAVPLAQRGVGLHALILPSICLGLPTAAQLARLTRSAALEVLEGEGPRAAQALMLTVRARALLQGRLAPSPEDVLDMAKPVLVHRMALSFSARARGEDLGALIDEVAEGLRRTEAAA